MTLTEQFQSIRSTTAALCSTLSAEDQQVQSMPDTSPTKWHLAHTTWFFETFLLVPHDPDYTPFHPRFGYLFNSYYNAVGARNDRPARGLVTRPSLDEVKGYRRFVEERVHRLLEDPDRAAKLESVTTLGLNHEQQHQELLLTDIKHVLGTQPLQPPYADLQPQVAAPVPAPPLWNDFAEGVRIIGHCGPGFAFDNEGPHHRVFIPDFSLADRLVTCGDYLEFIEDDGYGRPELWLSEGWDALQAQRWFAPLYWIHTPRGWKIFTLGGIRDLNAAEPVCHVSYFEADAYARWAGARLPTEAEWELAAVDLSTPDALDGSFLDGRHFHPIAPRSQSGLRQLFGEVWQWTQSAYAPYPRYRPLPGALGEYNGKFMSGQMVLRGGSCVTPRSHIRATYRNFFPPAARWQFSGIRLARDPFEG